MCENKISIISSIFYESRTIGTKIAIHIITRELIGYAPKIHMMKYGDMKANLTILNQSSKLLQYGIGAKNTITNIM